MNLQRFNKAVRESGFSDAEIGRKIGVSRQTIGQYRKGERKPSEGNLEALAGVLRTNVLWLMGYDEADKEITLYLEGMSEENRNKVLGYAKDLAELEQYRKKELE